MKSLRDSCHVLGQILYKINVISRTYLPLCLFQSLINSLSPLVAVFFSSYMIDALVSGMDTRYIILLVLLSLSVALVLNVAKALLKQKLEYLSIYIENELQLSVNMAMIEARYDKLEDSQVYLQVQKIQDGHNMVGKVTKAIQHNLGGIIQFVFGILIYLPVIVKLVRSDLNVNWGNNQLPSILTAISSQTLLFLLLLLVISFLYILIKASFQKKERILVESFLDVERAYGYYVSLRAEYEYGADIRLNGLRDMLKSRMEEYTHSERKMHFSICGFEGISDMCLTLFSRFQFIAIYAYIACKIICGAITIGEFYLFTNALLQTTESIRGCVSLFADLKLVVAYYDAYLVLWKLKEKDEQNREADYTAMKSPVQGEIVFENVSFRYGNNEQWVLHDLNLTIHAGEHIAVVGRNGTGKSTLMKLLIGLYPLEKGHIYFQGKDIELLSREERFSLFGIIFQDYRMMAATVAENIAGTDDNIDYLRVKKILKDVGMYERLGSDGDKLIITRHLKDDGIMFSGGEEQKLMIGRALYKNAPIIVMDEPMASLDPIAEHDINMLTSELLEGTTTLIVSHRLSTCVMCDRIVVLEGGKIMEEGTHEYLLNQGKTYAKMWKAQAQYYQEKYKR